MNNKTDRLSRILDLLEASPTDTFLLFALAKEYEGIGQTDEALAQFEKLRQLDPEYLGLYYHYGELLFKTNQLEKAEQLILEGIEIGKRQNAQKDVAELLQLLESY